MKWSMPKTIKVQSADNKKYKKQKQKKGMFIENNMEKNVCQVNNNNDDNIYNNHYNNNNKLVYRMKFGNGIVTDLWK